MPQTTPTTPWKKERETVTDKIKYAESRRDSLEKALAALPEAETILRPELQRELQQIQEECKKYTQNRPTGAKLDSLRARVHRKQEKHDLALQAMKVAEKNWEDASKELTEAKTDLQGVEEQIAKETGHVTEQMKEHLDNAHYSLETLQKGLTGAPEAVMQELAKIQQAMAKCKEFFAPKVNPTLDVSSTESEQQEGQDAAMPQASQKRQHQEDDGQGKRTKKDAEQEGTCKEAEAAAAPVEPAAAAADGK